MLLGVRGGAAQAVLFVGQQHDAHRPARPDAELLHQPQRLPRDDAADAVVGGAGADVPRVEMAAEQHDLVRLLAPADLADDVRRLDVGLVARLE